MSIRRSLARRLDLARGSSPVEMARILLFSSKDERRQRSVGMADALLDAGTLIDLSWYADVHQLASTKLCRRHFSSVGCKQLLAPNAGLAAADGVHLSQWGVEFLLRRNRKLRLGLPSGAPLNPSDPDVLHPFSLSNPSNKKIAVVSAIFGGYDRLLPIDPKWAAGSDFYLFSDAHYDGLAGWKQVYSNYYHADPRRRARFIKTHLPTYFSDYEWVMWIDANILMCADPVAIFDRYRLDDVDFAAFRHGQRDNIISEAAACLRLRKDDAVSIVRHLKENSGHRAFRKDVLFETMVMFMRPSSPAVRQMCSRWWRYITRGSKRDQLSLPLAIDDVDSLQWSYFPEKQIRTTGLFFLVPH